MKAQEWLQRSRKAEDPIDGFSNAWRAFNNLYYQVNGPHERAKILHYLEESVNEELAAELLAQHEGQVSYLVGEPVIDMRGNGRNTANHIQAFQVVDTSLGKLKELFMIIYQVRCNLEHGQKSPSRDRDVELCRSARPLVERVVEANA